MMTHFESEGVQQLIHRKQMSRKQNRVFYYLNNIGKIKDYTSCIFTLLGLELVSSM